jgi:streptogramin lyase
MAAIFGLVSLVYLSLLGRFINYSSPPTGDQPSYLMVTMSILQDFDLELSNNFAQRDEDKFYSLAPHPPDFVGISAPYPLPPHSAFSNGRPSNEIYNFHFPGLSVLIIPAWVVGGWFQLWWPMSVAFMCVLGALLVLNVFLLAHELTGRLWIAWVVALSLAFANPIMSYSYMIFTELPTALFVIYAFRRLSLGWGENGPWRLALIGFCIAYLPWMNWRGIVLSAPLGLYAAIQWWRYYRVSGVGYRRSFASSGRVRWRLWGGEKGEDKRVGSEKVFGGEEEGSGTKLRMAMLSALAFLAPIIALAGLLIWHNYYIYGAPTPPGAVPELGPGVSPFRLPWAGLDEFTHFIFNAIAHFFDWPMGLVTNAPIYLLSFVGMIALFRSRHRADRRLLFAIVLVAAPFFALVCAFMIWNGLWNPPARFLTTVAPLMAAPLAMSLYAAGGGLGSLAYAGNPWVYRGLYALMAIPGFLLMAIRMHDARTFWPANTISSWLYENPASPIKGNFAAATTLDTIFPAFGPPNELRLPTSSAWVLGVSVVIVLFGYAITSGVGGRGTSAARDVRSQRSDLRSQVSGVGDPSQAQDGSGVGVGAGVGVRRQPLAVHALVWLGVIGLLAGGWLLINRNYLRHKTVLTEVHRWNISPPMVQGLGMAYHEGSIYIADFAGGAVGRLNILEGTYHPLPLSGGEGTPAAGWHRPGDVEVGANGLLYVLNNGAGENGLLVVDANGTIVGRYALEGKSEIAVGLSLGADGNVYVADMVGSKIARYGEKGGNPVAVFAPEGGFNNVQGVVVGPDGSTYAADTGNRTVHRFNSDHSYARGYEMGCVPLYMAMSGEWMEVSCEGKLVSLNLETGYVQSTIVEGGGQLSHPVGIVYGPDRTLYVFDSNAVVAYKVRH